MKYSSNAGSMRSVYTNTGIISVAGSHSPCVLRVSPAETAGYSRLGTTARMGESDNWSLGHRFRVTRNPIRRTIRPIGPRLEAVENQVERTSWRAAILSPLLSSSRHLQCPSSFFSHSTGVKGASSGTRHRHS